MVVLATLQRFREVAHNIYGNEFKWSAGRKYLHGARMAILLAIQGAPCAVAYDIVDAGSHMRPIEASSQRVVHVALVGVSRNCQIA